MGVIFINGPILNNILEVSIPSFKLDDNLIIDN